jgi:hypothetical protein
VSKKKRHDHGEQQKKQERMYCSILSGIHEYRLFYRVQKIEIKGCNMGLYMLVVS